MININIDTHRRSDLRDRAMVDAFTTASGPDRDRCLRLARAALLARAPATVRADVTARRRQRALASAVTGDWPVVG